MISTQTGPAPAPRSLTTGDTSKARLDGVIRTACRAAAVSVVLVAALLVGVLAVRSFTAVRVIGTHFFVSSEWKVFGAMRWSPVEPLPPELGFDDSNIAGEQTPAGPPPLGALAFVYGTLVSSALAMLIAVPLGVGTAAFLSELAPPWLRQTGATLVEMLAAVPSVVYGFWGLLVLGPKLQQLSSFVGGPDFGGAGLFPAGIVLGIMVLPYVCAVSFDVCRAVPAAQRQASLALGATRWQTIWNVVLLNARPGIVAACFIALGRALGETMAVTMIIGNNPQISGSIFAKGATIASVIANEMPTADYELYRSALVELGLILFGVTLAVNAGARTLLHRMARLGPKTRFTRWRERMWAAVVKLFRRPSREPSRVAFATPAAARTADRVMTWLLGLCLALTLGPLFFILGYILVNGASGLDAAFFAHLPRAMYETGGGLGHAMLGSGLLVSVATAVAVPVGLLTAVYLAEYKSGRFGSAVRFVAESLGGVPSIVIGIVAYVVVVQGARWAFGLERAAGFGWAGAAALAVMMLPIVIRTSEEAIKLVPKGLRSASYALGASQAQTLLKVTLPAARPALLTAVFLSISRVIGETAPLLLTSGISRFWPRSLNDYTPSLPYYIYDYANSPDPIQQRQAWAAALVLLTVVMGLNYGVRFATGKRVVLAASAE